MGKIDCFIHVSHLFFKTLKCLIVYILIWKSLYQECQFITKVIKLLQRKIASSDREIFGVLSLDTKGHIATYHEAHIGTLNKSSVHPREIFKSAILSNTSSTIVGHNHPSGDVTPLNSDLKVLKA